MKWDEALERMAQKRTRLDLDLLAGFATMVKAMNVQKSGSVVKKPPRRAKS